MPGNISQFISNINQKGIAKTSHFDVDFSLPAILLPDTATPRLLKLRCESAELPGRQIGTTENRIYGPIYKTPYDSVYDEMSMTFVDTADMSIRVFFELWIDQVFNSETNSINYIDDVVSDIFVRQYDQAGTPDTLNSVLAFRLIRAFPTNVNQLTVSWADDSPHVLGVTFFYERYVIDDGALEAPAFSTEDSLPKPDYMIEYPEHPEFNDIQMNEMQRAKEEAAKNQRKDQGLFGNVVKDIANKVKGFF